MSPALYVLRIDQPYPWETLRALSEGLPTDERERIVRFRRTSDAQRCLAGQLLVREVLGECSRLRRTAHGRPYLDGGGSGLGDFNVSHSGPWVVLACHAEAAVGVDVEVEREASRDLMRLIYTREERARVGSERGPGFRAAFYRQWTLKESFVKAVGLGLSFPLAAFGIDATDPDRIALSWTGPPLAAAGWRFRHSTAFGSGCHLAVCTRDAEPPHLARRLRLRVEAGRPVFTEEGVVDLAAAAV